jgi:DNA (cytosine-5)-methyltransferase 1
MKGKRSAKKWLTAVDLYSGSGSVTAALKRRHFRVVAAVDNDPVACKTYHLNHPGVRMIRDDIRDVNPAEIRKNNLKNKDLDLLVVCAPCQPFSSQNRKRGKDDRARLILQAGRFARILRPRLIFFENVPGLASARHSPILEELRKALGKDYQLGKPHRVDAADYAVPQRRVRCIMLATRKAQPPELPPPLTPPGQRVTVRQSIGHLKKLASGQLDPQDALHAARHHSPIALERLSAVPKDGGSRSALPKRLKLACHSKVKGNKFSDVYGRMSWKKVAPTLTTGCTDVTRGRFGHPRDDRAITLREASLLQTFPSNYRFAGMLGEIQTQIGNAVPMQLIDALIPTLRIGIAASDP